jgi:hypothetical protein
MHPNGRSSPSMPTTVRPVELIHLITYSFRFEIVIISTINLLQFEQQILSRQGI